jgi:hypothetical protein
MSAARKVRQTAKKDHDSRGAHCSLARHSALPSTLPKGSGCHFWTYILRDYGSKELKVATKLILMHECIFYNHWVRGGSGENPIFFWGSYIWKNNPWTTASFANAHLSRRQHQDMKDEPMYSVYNIFGAPTLSSTTPIASGISWSKGF